MARVVKDAAERREEIISTACELFLCKGYEKTTMQDVMRRLQVAKGTIYHYFRSKEELLDAVIDSIAELDFKAKEELVAGLEGDALEKIRKLVVAGSKRDDDLHRDMVDSLHQPGNAGMHIRLLARILALQAPLYAELIRQGCEEGVFRTEYPLECAEFILSGVQFLTDLGIYPWPGESLIRRARALPFLVEAQLNAQPGSFGFLAGLLE